MKYIIYCRKSSEAEDRQALSIESQENELFQIAKKSNIEIVKILKESKSAKSPGRPVFNELLTLLEKGKADGILCWKLDRLARNSIDGGKIQWLLQSNLIKNIKTSDRDYLPTDNALMMAVELGMANQYIRDLSNNVKRGLKTKLERGEWPSYAPLGYLNDRANKTIIIDKLRAPYIQKAFKIYSTGGYSLKEVVNILYNDGLRTRSGKKVYKSFFSRIFSDPFYYGIMKRDTKLYNGNHKPIISKELFEQVQYVSSGKSRPKTKKLFFSLRGFFKCHYCGCALTSSRKKGHNYYYCTNGKKICTAHKKYLKEKQLHDTVAKIFSDLKFDDELIELMYQTSKEKLKRNSTYTEQSIESLEKQLNLVLEKESRLLDAYSSGIARKELYELKIKELGNESVILKSQIKKIKKNNPNDLSTLELTKKVFLDSNRARKKYLLANEPQKREVVKNLLWNINMKDQNMASVKLKMPYSIIAKSPKKGDFEMMLPN